MISYPIAGMNEYLHDNGHNIPYSGYFPGGKIFVDVQIFFHSWFNVRGVRRSRPHVFKIIGVVIPCI